MNLGIPVQSTWTDYHPYQFGDNAYLAPYEPTQNAVPVGEHDGYYDVPPGVRAAYSIASTLSMAAGAYHGYKRNNSVGWALGWAFFGAVLPVIAVPVMLAQGFGERKRG